VFCSKVVKNRNAEDCAEEVTHEAIDGPSFHQRSVDGGRRLEVQASGSNSGNFDQVWGYGRIDGPSTDRRTVMENRHSNQRLVPLPKVEEKLTVERWRHRRTVCVSTDYAVGPSIGSEKMQG